MGCCDNIKIAEPMNKRETSLSVRLKLIGRRKIKIYRRCIHVIRKANEEDITAIVETYRELLIYEQQFGSNSNWKLDVYPTSVVPKSKIPTGTMYVLYAEIEWQYPGGKEDVLVIHTLCIPPRKAGHGYGHQMVEYAKHYAEKNGCMVIRIDTYAHNEPAKRLYLNNGFRIAGYGRILLQGLIEEEQVYLECEV